MLTFCKESDKFFVCLKSLKNLLTFPAHLIFFEYSFYTCNLKKTWNLKLLSRVHLRHFCISFKEKVDKWNHLTFKKTMKCPKSQEWHIKVEIVKILASYQVCSWIIWGNRAFCCQRRPYLLDSDFQFGPTTHRVNPGVSGWVYKLWLSNPNRWSIKDLIPEKSPAKKYSKEWQSPC